MKTLLCGLLLATAVIGCKKDDPTPPVEYPVSAGRYSVAFDSTKFEIDSMQVVYNDTTGVKTDHVHQGYSWQSPVIQYRENDSAFAQVTAWGRYRLYTTFLPRMTFSGVRKDSLNFSTDVLSEETINGKTAFIVGRSENY
ncbi:MAG: hypothetical protein EOP52_09570 [Sphingobacteriales bacterium]|nr:MAG: hypothetical protein EOP52_09570 [Sphingobacteriales bacterium]